MISRRRMWICSVAASALLASGLLVVSSYSQGSAAASTANRVSTLSAVRGITWGNNVTIKRTRSTWTFKSDDIPTVGMQAMYPVPNSGVTVPNSASEAHLVSNPTKANDVSYTLPLHPEWTKQTTSTPLGPIGVIIDGAVLFNPDEANASTIALEKDFTIDGYGFVDSCNGHPTPAPKYMYHYHGVPTCIAKVLNRKHHFSKIVGFAFDGFPIYAEQGPGGKTPTDLDKCNGTFGPTPDFPQGIYHYFLTKTYPYSLPCLHGKVNAKLFDQKKNKKSGQ